MASLHSSNRSSPDERHVNRALSSYVKQVTTAAWVFKVEMSAIPIRQAVQ